MDKNKKRCKKYRQNKLKKALTLKYSDYHNNKFEQIDDSTKSSESCESQSSISDIEYSQNRKKNCESNELNFSDCYPKKAREIEEIQEWIVTSRIPHVHADKLLQILNRRLLPSLPKSTKTLLESNIKFDIENMEVNDGSAGEFFYFSVKNKLEPDQPTDPLNVPKSLNILHSTNIRNPNNEYAVGESFDTIAPVINLPDVNCKSGFETAVMAHLALLTADIDYLKRRQDETSNYLLDKKVVNLTNYNIDFEKKYNFVLPITNINTFIIFDETLKSNNFLKNDVCSILNSCIDKNFIISKSFLKMLRTFISKDIALKCTATRKARGPQSNEKTFKFKATELCRAMDAVIIGVRKSKSLETTEKELITALSDVICNAKKWST